jgi:hypothetical protein
MPKPAIPPLTTTTKREILDVDGTPLASLGVFEKAGQDDAGVVQKQKTYVSIVTEDRVVYHSGMDVKLVVCMSCRRGLRATWFRAGERPSHGLCTEANAVRCTEPGCGSWICPRHARKVGGRDGRWVCRDCATSWKNFLRSIFLRREED